MESWQEIKSNVRFFFAGFMWLFHSNKYLFNYIKTGPLGEEYARNNRDIFETWKGRTGHAKYCFKTGWSGASFYTGYEIKKLFKKLQRRV